MLKWLVSLMQCQGRHHYMMHFLGERKTWECTRCGRIVPIPESLTRPSGAFTAEARERAREILHAEQARPTNVQDLNQFKTRKKRASSPD